MEDGETIIVENVPANAKVTFGMIHAGKENNPGWGRNYALRIYTSENNQLAVFTGIKDFRDLSLQVQRRVVEKEQLTTDHRNGDRRDVQTTTAIAGKFEPEVF